MDADEPSAAEPQPQRYGVRGLVRAFGRRLVAVGCGKASKLSRAAGRGPALATSRQSGKSGDKSPHSKFLAGYAQSFIIVVRIQPGATSELLLPNFQTQLF